MRSLAGRLLLYDALAMRFREMKLRRDPDCPICGDRPSIAALIDYHQFCGVLPEAAAENEKTAMLEIEPKEVREKLDRGEDFVLVDVREPHEAQICSIPGAKLIPLGDLPNRVGELDPDTEIVTHCKGGVRSMKALEFLKQQGFSRVRSMKGGILLWSDTVDPSVPKY